MSWQSTADYYRLLNQRVAERLGGLHSAALVMHSVDFGEIEPLMRAGDWAAIGATLARAAAGLERAGAQAIVLATNSMHQVAPVIERSIRVPFLHIVDPTGAALARSGVRRAGLLGTRYTMELPFWRERLAERFGIELVVPEAGDRQLVNRVIFDELCLGRCEPASRAAYVEVTERLASGGAEAVIFGCTEIGMLLGADDVGLPAFDTTTLHVEAALAVSLATEATAVTARQGD